MQAPGGASHRPASGGSPYTSGSSSSRKNAPKPPTPSSGSSPYSRRRSFPPRCTWSSRSPARSRSSLERPELDRLGRAGLGAGRRRSRPACGRSRACTSAPAVGPSPRARQLAAVEHAERAGGDAVAAAVAHVLLDDDGAELGADQRAGGADVEAGGVGAVLADVGAHQPAQRRRGRRRRRARRCRCCSMKATCRQRVGAQRAGVVVRVAGEAEPVLGDAVPLLAGDLARLAADADAGVGEEADALLRLVAVALRPRPPSTRGARVDRARSSRAAAGMSQVAALDSWMCTLGSSTISNRSLAESPRDEAARAPVVRQPDLVHDAPALDAQRLDPLGDQHPRLDRGPRG